MIDSLATEIEQQLELRHPFETSLITRTVLSSVYFSPGARPAFLKPAPFRVAVTGEQLVQAGVGDNELHEQEQRVSGAWSGTSSEGGDP